MTVGFWDGGISVAPGGGMLVKALPERNVFYDSGLRLLVNETQQRRTWNGWQFLRRYQQRLRKERFTILPKDLLAPLRGLNTFYL